MITKPLNSLTAEDLDALVSNAVEEGREIDFKRELPGLAEKDKHELSADVSSFANASGGFLLFGVEETGGIATGVPGIPPETADAAILRIEQVLISGIDPPVSGIASRAVPTSEGKVVIVVRVPKSWRAPHLVKTGGSFRMYARTSRGKQPLDAQEIRRSFEGATEMASEIRRWREDRIARILGGDTPVPLAKNAKLVLQLFPLDSFVNPHRIAVSDLSANTVSFPPLGRGGYNHRINLDGYLTYSGSSSDETGVGEKAYCQVFRSGRVEAVWADLAREDHGRRLIPSVLLEQNVLSAVTTYLKSLSALDTPFPIAVFLSILEAKGAAMVVRSGYDGDVHPVDRDVLMLPEILFEESPVDLPGALRPIFDAVWNACGVSCSLNYDATGRWLPG